MLFLCNNVIICFSFLSEFLIIMKNKKSSYRTDNAPLDLLDSQFATLKTINLGKLAAGILHEIGSPVSLMRLITSCLHEELNQPEFDIALIKESADKLDHSLTKIEYLLNQLKSYLRDDFSTPRRFHNINDILERSLVLITKELKNKDITLHTSFYDQMPEFSASEPQIQSIVQNIVLNSIESFDLDDIDLNREITIKTMLDDDSNIKLIIQDNGQGIARKNLSNIFSYMFSTKKEDEGTGLGLYITKHMIENHDGKVKVTSALDKGTTFTIIFPIQEGAELLSDNHKNCQKTA